MRYRQAAEGLSLISRGHEQRPANGPEFIQRNLARRTISRRGLEPCGSESVAWVWLNGLHTVTTRRTLATSACTQIVRADRYLSFAS